MATLYEIAHSRGMSEGRKEMYKRVDDRLSYEIRMYDELSRDESDPRQKETLEAIRDAYRNLQSDLEIEDE